MGACPYRSHSATETRSALRAELREASRFARHIAGRAARLGRATLAEAPAAIAALLFALGLPALLSLATTF